jgi:23S rRNA (guanine745-N1)-methyltransferase
VNPTLLCTVRDCRNPLTREERRYVCANNHSFDIARSGYVNLLQPQDRRSRNPGDSAEAVQARRQLSSHPAIGQVIDAVVAALPIREEHSLLDVGCGEGSYLETFRRRYGARCHGVDISVPAIDLAARSHPHCAWVVANADRFIPWADASFDAVVSITGRLSVSEIHRALNEGGSLLVVIPAADDLWELRREIHDHAEERDRVERTIAMFTPYFTLLRHDKVRTSALLADREIVALMTTAYRALRSRERARLLQVSEIDVTMSRDLLLFLKG